MMVWKQNFCILQPILNWLMYMYHICPYIICTGEYYAPLLLTENLEKAHRCVHVDFACMYHIFFLIITAEQSVLKKEYWRAKHVIFWLHECHTHRLLIVQKNGWRAEHYIYVLQRSLKIWLVACTRMLISAIFNCRIV